MSSIEMCRPALVLDSGTSHVGDFDLAAAAASQVEVALVSQEGETTVEESVAMDGSELSDDLFPNIWLETLTLALMIPLPLDKVLFPFIGKTLLTTG